MSAADIAKVRILELGDTSYFKTQYPERTTLLWAGARLPFDRSIVDGFATPLRVLRELRSGKHDIVVCYPTRYSPWHPRYWARAPLQTPFNPWASLTRQFGVSMLRFTDVPVPLVGVDMDDAFGIGKSSVFLLDKADVFFKRELPVDRWQVLYGTVHPHLPTLRFRNNERWRRRMKKLHPISLPQFGHDAPMQQAPFPEKTHDIFFAGGVGGNSSVRGDGLRELERLKAQGYRIDQPAERMEYRAYLGRMSRSWIAWSPEGLGWDCNRHYEAAMVQSVPLMNNPTIQRHAPLLEGVHGLYYDPESGGLERAAATALADKDRLKRMAIAARDLVFAHHTGKAYCDHIIRSAFDAHAGR